jgi:hypothetical protein
MVLMLIGGDFWGQRRSEEHFEIKWTIAVNVSVLIFSQIVRMNEWEMRKIRLNNFVYLFGVKKNTYYR